LLSDDTAIIMLVLALPCEVARQDLINIAFPEERGVTTFPTGEDSGRLEPQVYYCSTMTTALPNCI